MDGSGAAVRHNADENRFEAVVDGGLAVAEYERRDGQLVFTHTEVPQEARRKGVGDALARAGMEYARAEGLRVVPRCPFIAKWLSRHPEYQDLRAD